MTNWNLSPDQLIVTTTDNGASIVVGFRDRGWMRLSCFSHNLDLAIQKGLNMQQHHPQIEKVLSRCTFSSSCFQLELEEIGTLERSRLSLV